MLNSRVKNRSYALKYWEEKIFEVKCIEKKILKWKHLITSMLTFIVFCVQMFNDFKIICNTLVLLNVIILVSMKIRGNWVREANTYRDTLSIPSLAKWQKVSFMKETFKQGQFYQLHRIEIYICKKILEQNDYSVLPLYFPLFFPRKQTYLWK